MAAVWGLAALVVLVYVWGSPERTALQFPDEMSSARGIHLTAETGRPVADVPFEDPSSLNRMRMWADVPDGRTAAYPTALPFLYGSLRALPGGAWAIFVLPAMGVAAMAAAAARLAGDRPWLGAAAPALAFPATYWILRPWVNVSLELALAMAALWCLVRWWTDDAEDRWAYAAVALATLAAVVRPDHVHLLLGSTLIWTLARRPRRWPRWLGVHVLGGLVYVGLVVAGNLATTGEALTTPIDLLAFPEEFRDVGTDLGFPFRELVLVVAPKGIPPLSEIARQLGKYWLRLGPVAPVVVGGLVVAGVLARRAVVERRAVAVATTTTLALLIGHTVSRVDPQVWGANLDQPWINHTIPRYTALLYVAFALLIVASVARLAGRRLVAGAAAVAMLAAAGAIYPFLPPVEADGWVAHRVVLREADAYARDLAPQLPADAIAYSIRLDRYLWPAVEVGITQVERPLPGAPPIRLEDLPVSFAAALDAGYTPYVFELDPGLAEELAQVLAIQGLALEPTALAVPPVTGIVNHSPYRVVAAPA